MNEFVRVVAAGGTFASAALAGLVAGIFIGSRSHQPFWAFIGLIAGLALGAYSAVRLLLNAK